MRDINSKRESEREREREPAAMEDVKILGHWVSPFVYRPMIALNLKKVECEFIGETMAPKSELLLKSNPVHKKIPVLFHKDIPISESLIIVEYIDETWTSNYSILPKVPYDRATARFWASFIDQKWVPRVMELRKAKEEEIATIEEQLADETELLEEAFKTCSKGGNWFGGEEMGFLDIVLGSFVAWTRATEKVFGVKILDGEKSPLLATWADRFCAEDSVKNVMPETDKVVEFFKMMLAKYKAGPTPK